MSGSPLFAGGRVVGCAIGSFRTEQVEDSSEEVREINGATRVTVVRRIFDYGKAFSFAAAAGVDDPPMLENKPLLDFLAERNKH